VLLERLGARGIKIDMKTGAPSPPLKLADVGTGSGCLAVALAHELPHATIVATDVSGDALRVAQGNAHRHRVAERIHFLQTNLLDAVLAGNVNRGAETAASFDAIVSNPPYVALDDAATLPREVREHEPHVALFAGRTGTELYGRLIEQSATVLGDRGVLVVELSYNSADHVLKLVRETPGWANVSVTKDLAGIPRVLAAERLR
jgi:release factor glutamine methyltransferase